MTRNSALSDMAKYEKFTTITAKQVLDADGVSPAFRAGLAIADVAFFRKHSEKPARYVALACLQRCYSNPDPRVIQPQNESKLLRRPGK